MNVAAVHPMHFVLERAFGLVERVYVNTGLGMPLLRRIEARLPPLT